MLCGHSGQVNFMEMAVEFLTGMYNLYIFKNGTKKNKKRHWHKQDKNIKNSVQNSETAVKF